MSAAIAFAQAGLHVAVVETIPAPDQLASKFDGRVSAISLGSKRLLENIGVWQGLAREAEPILDIRVVDAYSPFFLHYDHSEVGTDPFGWIVENRHIREALFARAAELSSHITIHAPARMADFSSDGARIEATLQDGTLLGASLMIIADGRNSITREQAGFAVKTLPYDQTAIVCTIQHTEPHNGVAMERFFPQGPFAVLPMQGNRSSLVWTENAHNAKLLLSLPDDAFIEEIERRVGAYLGKITLTGARFSHPLALVHAESYIKHRIVLAGDTAHGIHPIAGQGVNLGFRDVAALAEIIEETHALGLDIGLETSLSRYTRWRSFDAVTMVGVTDALTRLFSNNIKPIALARRLGLAAVGKVPPLKKLFMRNAMGIVGDLPKLMQERKDDHDRTAA